MAAFFRIAFFRFFGLFDQGEFRLLSFEWIKQNGLSSQPLASAELWVVVLALNSDRMCMCEDGRIEECDVLWHV